MAFLMQEFMLLQPHYSVLPGRVSGGRESKGVEKRERGRKKKKEKKWIEMVVVWARAKEEVTNGHNIFILKLYY